MTSDCDQKAAIEISCQSRRRSIGPRTTLPGTIVVVLLIYYASGPSRLELTPHLDYTLAIDLFLSFLASVSTAV